MFGTGWVVFKTFAAELRNADYKYSNSFYIMKNFGILVNDWTKRVQKAGHYSKFPSKQRKLILGRRHPAFLFSSTSFLKS